MFSTIDSSSDYKVLMQYCNGNNGKSCRKEELTLLSIINSEPTLTKEEEYSMLLLRCSEKETENSGHLSVLQLMHNLICMV